MKQIAVNDRIGSRSRKKLNLIVVKGKGVLEFKGQSIAPAVKVLNRSYERGGKWSHTTWTVELDDSVEMVTLAQDWGTGDWLPVESWEEAVKYVGRAVDAEKNGICAEALVLAVRGIFPTNAARLDASEAAFAKAGNDVEALLKAQAELAAAKSDAERVKGEIRQLEEAERMLAEAADLRSRTERAKSLMGQKVSLAELKAAMGMN